MKKKILFVLLAVCLALPLAFVMSACKKGGSGGGKEENVVNINIEYNGSESTYQREVFDYGEEVNVLNNVKVIAHYNAGKSKEIPLSDVSVKCYEFKEVNYEYVWTEIDSISATPNAGSYKFVLSYGGQEAEFVIDVNRVNIPGGVSFLVGENNTYEWNSVGVQVSIVVAENIEIIEQPSISLFYLTADEYNEQYLPKTEEERDEWISSLFESDEYGQNFIYQNNRWISLNENNLMYNSRELNHGTYYMFAKYDAFDNYTMGCTPVHRVDVLKGKLENFVTEENPSISMTFDFNQYPYLENPTLSMVNTSTYEASGLWLNWANVDSTDTAALNDSFGYFVFVNQNQTFSAADNGNKFNVVFEFSAGYPELAANIDTSGFTKQATLNIIKGRIERQSMLIAEQSEYSLEWHNEDNKFIIYYNGNEFHYTSYFRYSPNTTYYTIANETATNAGDYTMTLTLRNGVNYEWVLPDQEYLNEDEYYYGELSGATVSYAYEIIKANQSSVNYQSVIFNSNSESEIDWANSGTYTISLSPNFTFYPQDTTWTWVLYNGRDDNYDDYANIATLGSNTTSTTSNTITFTKPGSVQIAVSNTGDANFNPLVIQTDPENPTIPVYGAYIKVNKADLPNAAEITALGETAVAGTYNLTATNGVVYLPAGIIPQNPYTEQGAWRLVEYFNQNAVITTGDDTEISTNGEYYCGLSFVPTQSDYYKTICPGDVLLNVVKTDLEDANDIATEIPATYSVDMNGHGLGTGNVRSPEIISNSQYENVGQWTYWVVDEEEGWEDLYDNGVLYSRRVPGTTYYCGTEPHAETWVLVFQPTYGGLYNQIMGETTVYFMTYMPEYNSVYEDIANLAYYQQETFERTGDPLWFIVALTANNHTNLGTWNLYTQNGTLIEATVDGNARYWEFEFDVNDAGTHEYLLRFDIDANYENIELYYGPAQWVTLIAYSTTNLSNSQKTALNQELSNQGKIVNNNVVLELVNTKDQYDNSHYTIGAAAVPVANGAASGNWSIYLVDDNGDYYSFANSAIINDYLYVADYYVAAGHWRYVFEPDDTHVNTYEVVITTLDVTEIPYSA